MSHHARGIDPETPFESAVARVFAAWRTVSRVPYADTAAAWSAALYNRTAAATAPASASVPAMRSAEPGHEVRCHHPGGKEEA